MTWLYWAVPLIIVAVLLLVIIGRTLTFRPKRMEPGIPTEADFDRQKAIDDLQSMIRCATVSHYDPSQEDETEFERFLQLLPQCFPRVHQICTLERVGRRSLLYRWKGRGDGQPTVLMAHYDVVPADEDQWDKPPFAGIIENGVLWGRGSLDTKPTLNGILQAAETLLQRDFVPQNDIWLAFGGDEEVVGTDAPAAVTFFAEQGITPELVVDEGGAVVENIFPGVGKPCAVIGTAEKGMMHLEMVATSQGGHASAPPPQSSIGRLSRACLRVESKPLQRRLSPPVAGLFDTLGRHSSFVYRMIFANLWLFAGLLDLICQKKGGELNAMMRTTVAWTQAEGSKQTNVMPPRAVMGANLRLISGDSCQGTLTELSRIIADPTLQLNALSCDEPSPISPTGDNVAWQKLCQAVQAVWPDAIVSPYLMFACTDSRHYCRISKHVYRFSAMEMSSELRKTIHGNNERIPLDTIGKTVAFYLELISRC